MWMLGLVRANWVGGNYNGPLFPQNGLDKDWYCNIISISFHKALRMDVCLCRLCSCLFESDLVYELSDVGGNERVHMEVWISKWFHGEAQRTGSIRESIITMKWGEKRWKQHIWLGVSEKWIALYLILGRYSVKAWVSDRELDSSVCSHGVEEGEGGAYWVEVIIYWTIWAHWWRISSLTLSKSLLQIHF